MRDILNQQVNIGDKVFIAYGKYLHEGIFAKETKTSFIVKIAKQERGFSISKTARVANPQWDQKAWDNSSSVNPYNIPYYVDKDISQEPCKRIIKI